MPHILGVLVPDVGLVHSFFLVISTSMFIFEKLSRTQAPGEGKLTLQVI